MRIVAAQPGPNFSVQDVHNGWVEGLRSIGQQVFEFNLADRLAFYSEALLPTKEEGKFKRALEPEQAIDLAINGLYAAILKICPDVLLVVSAFFTPPALLSRAREVGVKVVVVHTESPYEDERQLAIAPHADLNLVNDPSNLDAFRALAPTEYFPHAYRRSVHYPGSVNPAMACDFAFVGTGFPSRVEFFEAMDLTDLDVALAGNWKLLDEDSTLRKFVAHDLDDCCDNTEAAHLYRSAKVGLNLYRREAEDAQVGKGWAMGPREVEQAACGLFFLRDPRPEGDEVLEMLPSFATPEDASEQLRYWLDHDNQRETAALKARDAIVDRTFDQHAARLLRLLEKE